MPRWPCGRLSRRIPTTRWPAMRNTGWGRPITPATATRTPPAPSPKAISAIRKDRRRRRICFISACRSPRPTRRRTPAWRSASLSRHSPTPPPRFASAPTPREGALAAAEALRLEELAAALAAIGGFEPSPLVAVGVSGGPDSLALMILTDRWARRHGGTAWGLIVDHRLRPESASEAATVAGWLAARGIPHTVLAWEGEKPATGIQEAARAARYRLLTAWCAAQGCLHLLTAHHRDDQVETYLIRRRAGSGVDGLAGMPAVRELSQLRLVRPLLGVPKARLAAFLDVEGQPCVRDPSNINPAFERARLRLGEL